VEICVIYAKNHDTKVCPSIHLIKEVLQNEAETSQVESLCFIGKIPGQPQ